MIVVADTSPFNYLIQIDCGNLLPKIYGRVIVPLAVIEELRHAGAPAAVREWLNPLPEWVETGGIFDPDPDLTYLGPGEREAIQISLERRADLLLMDERRGRLEARR